MQCVTKFNFLEVCDLLYGEEGGKQELAHSNVAW